MKKKAPTKLLSQLLCICTLFSNETDVLVLLMYWCKKEDVSCAEHMERWNGSALDSNNRCIWRYVQGTNGNAHTFRIRHGHVSQCMEKVQSLDLLYVSICFQNNRQFAE